MTKKYLVTGGAGFIGSHFVDSLLSRGHKVVCVDNLSSGKYEFIEKHISNPNFEFVHGDLLTIDLNTILKGVKIVAHLSANPDVRLGETDTKIHFEQNIFTTFRLLEAIKNSNVKLVLFASTSAVYGCVHSFPTPETYGPCLPVSLYGASKLACEALISSYSDNFNFKSCLFRFANVVGERGTHGVILDFKNKLKQNPKELEILGDGTQAKSFIDVKDCIDAIMFVSKHSTENIGIFNIGTCDQTSIIELANAVCGSLGLNPKNVQYNFTGGNAWKGDVKNMLLSTVKINQLGWKPKLTSIDAIKNATKK